MVECNARLCCTRRETLSAEDLGRYEAQYRYIRQICALYEDDPGNFNRLFGLIQEVRFSNAAAVQDV